MGILARVPLASGMLTGKMTKQTASSPPTITAPSTATARHSTSARPSRAWITRWRLPAVEELRTLVPPGATMAQLALRWILMFDAVDLRHPRRQASQPG